MDSIAVLDCGSHTVKAGFAWTFPTEEEPRVVTPNLVEVAINAADISASTRRPGAPPGVVGGTTSSKQRHALGSGFAGPTVTTATDAPGMHTPIVDGHIADLDQFEVLLHYILYELLGWSYGQEGSAVVAEPILTGRPEREALAQLLFEVFNVRGLFVQDQPTLSLYAIGRATGTVVDIGHAKTSVACVDNGALHTSSARCSPLAGQLLNVVMQRQLATVNSSIGGDGSGGNSSNSNGLTSLGAQSACVSSEVAQAVKEQFARCEKDIDSFEILIAAAAAEGSNMDLDVAGPAQTYTLPDGQQINVSEPASASIGEVLFRPGLMLQQLGMLPASMLSTSFDLQPIHPSLSSPAPQLPAAATTSISSAAAARAIAAAADSANLAEAAHQCISSIADPKVRHACSDQILVCGGGAGIRGLPARFLHELRALAVSSMPVQLARVPEFMGPAHTTRFAPWVGGAVMAKVVQQQGHFMSKADYEEAGPLAVHKRCGL